MPSRFRWIFAFVLAASLVSLLLLLVVVPLPDSGSDQPAAQPCPQAPRQARPVAFHFAPGLVEHQNWLLFNVPEPDATAFVLCFDSQLMAQRVGETPVNGQVTVSVPTRWVDARWLHHQLDADQAPDRWELRYTLYSLQR
jgi:hypothetical protein